jgi:hypothetical protein
VIGNSPNLSVKWFDMLYFNRFLYLLVKVIASFIFVRYLTNGKGRANTDNTMLYLRRANSYINQ